MRSGVSKILRLAKLLVNKIQGVVGDFPSDIRPDGSLLLEESFSAVVRNLTPLDGPPPASNVDTRPSNHPWTR
ncbi:hypothetical protein PsorP6_015748 [Peronosclerospora sorghi]|uniref:Uncharacterized protein n=1 Tax=Peronosclerospora sorghi TaxID=230839 RepID=A0ACC0WMK1_9STRA|nr:hypothetical protein PsorP6_015748 [Peronosclerospora sorghi]